MHLRLSATLIVLSTFVSSCAKQSTDCFDRELYQKNKDRFCTTDCPGIIGCDGNQYCNECDANRRGIRVVK